MCNWCSAWCQKPVLKQQMSCSLTSPLPHPPHPPRPVLRHVAHNYEAPIARAAWLCCRWLTPTFTCPTFTCPTPTTLRSGTLRVILKPLLPELPGFGAAVVSLRKPPIVRFNLNFGKGMGGGYSAGAIKVGVSFSSPFCRCALAPGAATRQGLSTSGWFGGCNQWLTQICRGLAGPFLASDCLGHVASPSVQHRQPTPLPRPPPSPPPPHTHALRPGWTPSCVRRCRA